MLRSKFTKDGKTLGSLRVQSCIDSPAAPMMQSYLARALDRRLQVDWARDAREGPRVLMSLRVDFGPTG